MVLIGLLLVIIPFFMLKFANLPNINHLVIKHGNEQSSFLIGTNVNPPIQWAMVPHLFKVSKFSIVAPNIS